MSIPTNKPIKAVSYNGTNIPLTVETPFPDYMEEQEMLDLSNYTYQGTINSASVSSQLACTVGTYIAVQQASTGYVQKNDASTIYGNITAEITAVKFALAEATTLNCISTTSGVSFYCQIYKRNS